MAEQTHQYTDKTPICFSCGSEIDVRVTTFGQSYMQDLVVACGCAEIGIDTTRTPDDVNWRWRPTEGDDE